MDRKYNRIVVQLDIYFLLSCLKWFTDFCTVLIFLVLNVEWQFRTAAGERENYRGEVVLDTRLVRFTMLVFCTATHVHLNFTVVVWFLKLIAALVYSLCL